MRRGLAAFVSRSLMSASRPPIVVQPKGKHDASMFILHGLGDTGNGWTDVAQMLAMALPHVKFILPTAPTRPISINMGMSMPGWYDIISLAPRSREDEPGIKQSAQYIRGLIQAEMDAGIPSDRIVLGGFSQGAAMSLYTGLTNEAKLAGILALSGYLLLGNTLSKEQIQSLPNKDTPILMCHGEEDPVVSFHFGKLSHDAIKGFGANIDFKKYPDLEHSVNDKELADIAAFVKRVLPPR